MSVSVIVPSRNDRYLTRTVDDIYKKFTGDFEVIVFLDGQTDFRVPRSRPDLTIIEKPESVGVRPAINEAVAASSGEYILKVDSHCLFGEGIDNILRHGYMGDEIVVARRYTLDLETWARTPRIVDYYYLSCPWTYPRSLMMQSCPWITKTEENEDIRIDDLMCFQGSLWFMSSKHWRWLGGLEVGGEVYAEHHEISMKTWLGGGRVAINKDAWYAHPKNSGRGYTMNMRQVFRDHDRSALFWTENKWAGRIHDFDWLIDKFWPLPFENSRHRLEKYYWPEDWRERYYDRAVRDR